MSSVKHSPLVVANTADAEVTHILQRATIVTSFDVHWSLVAQAIPENELLFFFKIVNLPESLLHA